VEYGVDKVGLAINKNEVYSEDLMVVHLYKETMVGNICLALSNNNDLKAKIHMDQNGALRKYFIYSVMLKLSNVGPSETESSPEPPPTTSKDLISYSKFDEKNPLFGFNEEISRNASTSLRRSRKWEMLNKH
ncbi:hypothetical protein HHI36_017374, partial [Cryptolaemus montrouzieri]